MRSIHSRRTAIALLAPLIAVSAVGCGSPAPLPAEPSPVQSPSAVSTDIPSPGAAMDVSRELQRLETEYDATIGVSAGEPATGRSVAYRPDTRFGYASTIKLFVAAEFLRRVPADDRKDVVTWSAGDVKAAGYSPVTADHVSTGLSLENLAEAAVRESDNTATNVLLDRIGGPGGLDAALAQWGDDTTHVARAEPALNEVDLGRTDDTTTPAAFTGNLTQLLNGPILPPDDRALLLEWMSGNATGDALIRAGAPAGWTVADKSGGAGPMRNDIAVVTPPGGDPLVLTVLTRRNDASAAYDDALVAEVAAVVLSAFAD
ncbi:class A beta-lactamase [Planctomonas psychrotolerans]|uniref:class A beta-lactamase n=1 Tax=Planctomonas psychrotolerans TaxID=2528712 RepID=UPI001D0D2BCF|nr:class A beta-lactamase [Planctomonas psychrotolerans]